jgi:hypothetical protein
MALVSISAGPVFFTNPNFIAFLHVPPAGGLMGAAGLLRRERHGGRTTPKKCNGIV